PSGQCSGSSGSSNSTSSDSFSSGISGSSVMAYSNRQETAPQMAQYGAIGTQNRKQSATMFTIRNTKRSGRLDGRLVGNQPRIETPAGVAYGRRASGTNHWRVAI